MRRRALATTLLVLTATLGAGVTGAGPAAAGEKGFHRQAASDVPLLRSDAPLPRSRAGLRTFTSRDGSTGTVVPRVATPPKSTWQVTYTGFNLQQQAAFQAAVDIWAGIVQSSVPIKVNADLQPTPAGLLGYAGPGVFYQDASLGDGSSYYPSALSDALVGYDIDSNTPDIEATFSSSEPSIYYGTDGLPPTGNIDFESVVLHELGHGLGFTGSAFVDTTTGKGSYEVPPLVYDTFNVSSTGAPLRTSVANNSAAMKTALTNGNVFWSGPNGVLANGGTRPELYAPSPWEDGSSIAHLDEDVYPAGNANSLMTPYLQEQEVVHSPGPVTVSVLADMGWKAAPGAPTNVTGDYGDQSVRVSWKAPPANGSAITGYDVQVDDGVTTTHLSAGTATSLMVTGLTNGTAYTFRVTASNVIGSGAQSAASAPVTPQVDVTAPAASSNAPVTWSHLAAGSIALSATDPDRPTAAFTYTCNLDGAGFAPCTSPVTYSGFTNGSTHTFEVKAKDEALNESTNVTLRTWKVDLTLPTVSPSSLPLFTLGSTVGLRWTGSDTVSGIANYDLRYRRAAFNGTFGSYATLLSASTATVKTITAAKGYTYCFSVRSRDKAGNVSAFSSDRCVASPLDDWSLSASSGWRRGTGSGYYGGTVTYAAKAGVTLTRTAVQTRQIALVASSCRGCGAVGVYWNGTLLRKISLASSSTVNRRVLGVVTFATPRSGTVVIKTLNAGQVRIDGLGLIRV